LANLQHQEEFQVSTRERWITPLCVLACIAVAGLIAWLIS
jgi:hypothetical protein